MNDEPQKNSPPKSEVPEDSSQDNGGSTPPGDQNSSEKAPPPRRPGGPAVLMIIVLLVLASLMLFSSSKSTSDRISYSFFEEQLAAGNIESIEVELLEVWGKFRHAPLAPVEEKDSDSESEDSKKEDSEKTAEQEKSSNEKGTAKSENSEKNTDTKSGSESDSNASRKKTDAKGEGSKTEKDNKAKEPKRLSIDFVTTLPVFIDNDFNQRLKAQGVKIISKTPSSPERLMMFLYLGVTILIIVGFWMMFRRTREQLMGGGLFSGISKSPAKRYDAEKKPVTFDDVAGLEGVKRDLTEVVEFLKSPEKFQRLGGKVPKGVLLMGPPGTGKTLLARAVAGEAGVPFFSINGSEFIQMFVGVGASRVRDMFKQAKEASPAILFVDEIDAVGRQRGAGLGGGHDEREQTLNQILSEMDGFDQTSSVIVLAATNRPDVLDPALLRPGRFDRHVTVDRPTLEGRKAIFEVHSREVPISDDVDFERLAAGTIGLTGADIRNLVNEAALWATRHDKDSVDMSDFETARDKILMGATREEILSDHEKKITAYHESGHALLAWILPGADRVHKVTIVPRGRALGVTQLLPEEERMNISESELRSRLIFMLGGRAAEKLLFHEYSAGAENDLKEGTSIARRMVTRWGMSERLGPVAFNVTEEHPFLGREMAHEHREFSEHTAQVIDEEITKILHGAAERATTLLTENRELLDKLALALIDREILDEKEIEELIGPATTKRVESNGKPVEKSS